MSAAFDIYQSAKGYVAVTNETRRRILEELRQGDVDLPHLMKATGKSKPTLSSIHVRELLADALIKEYPHPSDGRRKYYKLVSRRIGMSDVPLDELRGAVKRYSMSGASEPSLPLGATLDIVTTEGTPRALIEINARRVGKESAAYFAAQNIHDALQSIGKVLDQAGIARPQRLDYDANEIELEPLPQAPKNTRALADTIAGFFEGMLRASVDADARATGRLTPNHRVIVAITLVA